jgi:glycerol-3-phosphate acyltransferase PlsY
MQEIVGWLNTGLVLLAYLMGSIPTSVWIGKAFYGVDVREHGSGNAGATNTFRTLGARAGIIVLIFDCLKGFLPVMLIPEISPYESGSVAYTNLQVALGLGAVLGHIFPVFADFRGGKGVATLLGVVLALHLQAALISLGVFVLVFGITRFVSLGSLISAIIYPISLALLFREIPPSLLIFAVVFASIVIITHQKNIERLLRREEGRLDLNRRKKPDR